MKKVFLLLMCMGLASLTMGERVWAYSSLFEAGNALSYTIVENNNEEYDSIDNSDGYFGYTGNDYSGYYIGTIVGVNTDNGQVSPFKSVISYYLALQDYRFSELKVDTENADEPGIGSDDSSFAKLTVTWTEDEKTGTWSLSNSYGFGFYAVKGGNDFALYFVDPAQSSGKWTTRHLEVGNSPNGPNHPTISHLSGAPTLVHAPEPSSLLLLGGGLLGLGYVMRRRGK